MYLFHDGLVRMCTEEYVKPTKQVTLNHLVTRQHINNIYVKQLFCDFDFSEYFANLYASDELRCKQEQFKFSTTFCQ